VDTRLYLITYRIVNPFIVIDLSNHTVPYVLGELGTTDFSYYLHPYDTNTLIGFGREANEQSQQSRLKVSLFVVSNVQNILNLDSYVLAI
jgi:inhibitor of cysteine peptidase